MTDIGRIRRAQIEAAENMVVAGLAPELRQTEPRDTWRGGSSYEASMLRNLLARIHRDGGHYIEQHGLEKALEDAGAKVVQWLARDDSTAHADALYARGVKGLDRG
jgi:hypothetical protein